MLAVTLIGLVGVFYIGEQKSYKVFALVCGPLLLLGCFHAWAYHFSPYIHLQAPSSSIEAPVPLSLFGSFDYQAKISSFVGTWLRFDFTIDALLFAGILLLLMTFVRIFGANNGDWRRNGVQIYRFLRLSIMLIVISFLFLPQQWGKAYNVDERAVFFLVVIASIYACSGLRQGPAIVHWRQYRNCFLAVVSLVSLNLVYLTENLRIENMRCSNYIQALKQLPEGAIIFPIATIGERGYYSALTHTGALVVPMRQGVYSYLFSQRLGFSNVYFDYVNEFYIPTHYFYTQEVPINWEQVDKEYDYLVVTKPFDSTKLPLSEMQLTFENKVVATYKTSRKYHTGS